MKIKKNTESLELMYKQRICEQCHTHK